MMADAKKRKFDAVICWRFDRFARSTKHLITALEEFRHLGIEFVSYQENIDTSSPLGKAIFTIVSAIADRVEHPHGKSQYGLKEKKLRLGRPKKLD
jgi:DNA invertase Pin-like site-specific DNA recombinase